MLILGFQFIIGRKFSDYKLVIFLDVVFSKFGSVRFELPRRSFVHLENIFLFNKYTWIMFVCLFTLEVSCCEGYSFYKDCEMQEGIDVEEL